MSHIVTIKTQVRDPAAIELACKRLELSSRLRCRPIAISFRQL